MSMLTDDLEDEIDSLKAELKAYKESIARLVKAGDACESCAFELWISSDRKEASKKGQKAMAAWQKAVKSLPKIE